MIEFTYSAKTKDGEIQKGIVEAENEQAAAKVLTSRNLFPVSVETKEKSSFSIFNKISVKDKAFLIRQLATTISAGLPIAQALETLNEQITNKRLMEVLGQVSRDVEGGMTLSASFSRFPEIFNQIDITLISAGETSGSLDKSLLRLADTLENDFKIMKKIRGAMIYPAFVLATIFGVLIVMNIFVMPQMEDLFASFDAKLPILTRVLIATSHGLTAYSPFLLVIIVAAVVIIRNYVKTENGRYNWDHLKLSTPIVGDFLKKLYLARFSRTLAGLVGSGVPLLDSLAIVSKAIGNKVYFNILNEAIGKVKGGIPLSTPLKQSTYFPPIVSQMIRIGEQTGELDNMLTKLAEYYEDEVDSFVKNITSIIEPVIIVAISLIVAVVLLGVMMPIYNFGRIVH